MAGDWIPWDKTLTRKPEVGIIAHITGLSRREVAATLMEFWSWVDDHSEDGILVGTSVPILSLIVGDISEQFLRAIVSVGWLLEFDGSVAVPHFDTWIGCSAKRRLKAARKKRRQRHDPNTGGTSVPKVSPSRGDTCPESVPVSRGQKGDSTGQDRRKNNPLTPRGDDTLIAFIDFWDRYPRKTNKEAARKAWVRLSPDESLRATILAAVERQSKTEQWLRGIIPHASTWLNQKRWGDEMAAGPSSEDERARLAKVQAEQERRRRETEERQRQLDFERQEAGE
jgi:hypothetical protein